MRKMIDDAILFATDAFAGKTRKCSDTPAILHSLEAAAIVASMTSDIEIISAAVLHDVIEDTVISVDEVETRFGKRVCELVLSETENKRETVPPENTWRVRKEEAITLLKETKDLGVKMVFIGDKLSNIRSLYNDLKRKGDILWQQFHQKDPEAHHWYYRTIAQNTSELSAYPAWQEYDRLICEVFEQK